MVAPPPNILVSLPPYGHLDVGGEPSCTAGNLQQLQAGAVGGCPCRIQVAGEWDEGAALHRVLAAQEEGLCGALVDGG